MPSELAEDSKILDDDERGPPNIKVPKYLDIHKLTRRRYLNPATGNRHGLRSEDFEDVQCCMPRMYGSERYAFQLIDIDDPRYLKEVMRMSKKLIRFFYDEQIIENEWRKTYKRLLSAEHQRDTLSKASSQKTITEMEKEATEAHKYMLILQDQRDLFQRCIQEIWDRCDHIKASIKKEADLDELRIEMTDRVKSRFPPGNHFWQKKFRINHQGGSNSDDSSDESSEDE